MTATKVRCGTIGCKNAASVRIAHGRIDDRQWDDVCEECAEGYLRRPSLFADIIGAPFVCPREGTAQGYVFTIRRGAFGTGPGHTWRMGDPGAVDVLECKSCGAQVER